MNQQKLRGLAARISTFGAAAAVVSLLSFADANAAPVFSLSGGVSGTLPNNFDGAYTGLQAGVTAITIFDPTHLGGLKVSPNNVQLEFEFLGKEAGFTNEARVITPDGLIFTNGALAGTTFTDAFDVSTTSGFVPFRFRANTTGSPTTDANNGGGSIAAGLAIAFVQIAANSYYVLFDDAGGNPNDHDFDDLVMKVTANCLEGPCGDNSASPTPLPAAAWLLGSVLAGGAGFGRWRKRKNKSKAKRAALAPA
jgi:hypothetical protein